MTAFTLDKIAYEKHLRGKNKIREAMIESSGAEKLYKHKRSASAAGSGLMTNSGRRQSLASIQKTKEKVSGLEEGTLISPEEVIAPERRGSTKMSDGQSQDMIDEWINKGIMVDSNGDGQKDTMGYDTNGDGNIDGK